MLAYFLPLKIYLFELSLTTIKKLFDPSIIISTVIIIEFLVLSKLMTLDTIL